MNGLSALRDDLESVVVEVIQGFITYGFEAELSFLPQRLFAHTYGSFHLFGVQAVFSMNELSRVGYRSLGLVGMDRKVEKGLD